MTVCGALLLLASVACSGSRDAPPADTPAPSPTQSAARSREPTATASRSPSPTPVATASPSPLAAATASPPPAAAPIPSPSPSPVPTSPPPSQAVAVASAGGTIALDIPEGALPPGFDTSTIGVSTVSIAEPLPSQPPDPGAERQPSRLIAVFDLAPAGLRFLQPVTLTLRLPLDIVSGPLVALHASAVGIEPLVIALTDLPASGEVEITTTVEYFSSVLFATISIDAEDIIETTLDVPDKPVTVGSEFTVIADLERLDGTRRIDMVIFVDGDPRYPLIFNRTYELTVSGNAVWTLDGYFKRSIGVAVITPREVRDKPKAVLRVTGNAHAEEATFTCERVGDWDIFYDSNALIWYEATPDSSSDPVLVLPAIEFAPHLVHGFASGSGSCVAPAVAEEEDPPGLDNRAPVVSPIAASGGAPVTTYTITATDPDSDKLTIAWSGTTCGFVTGSSQSTMNWNHGTADCPHTTGHADATIVVFVSDGLWDVYCRYSGAGAGTGMACDDPVKSP